MGRKNESSQDEYDRLLARSRRRPLNASKQARLERLRSELGIGSGDVNRSVEASLKPTPVSVESLSEVERIDKALDEAVELGFIQYEDFGDPNADKRCIIMGSSHPDIVDISNIRINESTIRAHYELFCLLYIFQKYRVSSKILFEGQKEGVRMPKILNVHTLQGLIELQSFPNQKAMFDDFDLFKFIFESSINSTQGLVFSRLSAYSNTEGVHSMETLNELDVYMSERLALEPTLSRYGFNIDGFNLRLNSNHDVNGDMVVIARGESYYPQQVIDDMDNIMRVEALGASIHQKREAELAGKFESGRSSDMPMGWVGAAHLAPVRDLCLEKGMAVRIIKPCAELVDIEAISTKVPSVESTVAPRMRQYAEVRLSL